MPPQKKVDLGIFDVDMLIAETSKEPYRFTLGGKVQELPHFSTLTPRQAIALDMGEIESVLVEIGGKALTEKIMTLPGYAADEILKRWMNQAGTEPGESPASTRS